MCKWNKWGDTRIDPCMRELIKNLNEILLPPIKIVACCCGHRKYPTSIIVTNGGMTLDLVSGVIIPRKRKFYKKDKAGYYYIPEVEERHEKSTDHRKK